MFYLNLYKICTFTNLKMGELKMSYYIISKIREIEAKDISDEEKKKEIEKLVEDAKKRREEENNVKINKKAIGLILVIAIFLGVLMGVISSTNFFLRIKKYCEEEIFLKYNYYLSTYAIFLLVALVVFVYCVYKKIKLVKQEKHWKSVMKDETTNLQELCENLCNDTSFELKRKLKKIKTYKWVSILSIILPLVFLYALVLMHVNNMPIYGMITLFMEFLALSIVLVIMPHFIKDAKREYKNLYMKEVISKFVKIISGNLEYSNEETDLAQIKNNYIYSFTDVKRTYTMYGEYILGAEDYFSGNIDGINIKMADVVSYEYYTRRKGGSYEKILFAGNFMVLDMNKKYERFEIRLNKFKLLYKAETVEVDNQNFNKYFKIYAREGTNIQETVTPSLIEFLADFREKYGIDFEMFFEDKVYIRFYTDNMFEPNTTGKIVDQYSAYKFYVVTKFAKEFVKRFLVEE